MKVQGNRFRAQRFHHFRPLADAAAASKQLVRILDIGGRKSYWEALAPLWRDLPLSITIVNLQSPESDEGPYRIRRGDARCLSDYQDESFDIVHSNSVIEHVGGWSDMMAMAQEIRRLAPSYFVQTPNLWFPVEPHYRSPFFALYPEAVRAKKLMKRKRGFHQRASDFAAAIADVQSVNLLDWAGMRALFPDAAIVRERFLGMTKSLIAVRAESETAASRQQRNTV